MFVLFDKNYTTEIYCDGFEDVCIQKAVSDLQSDIEKVSGKSAIIKKYLPCEEQRYIVIGSLENKRFVDYVQGLEIEIIAIENKWEAYIMKTFGDDNQNLLICGSDPRGAMWGIYDLCEKKLEVDPLYFWTDNEPTKKEQLIFEDINIIQMPKSFKFRGWFLNDEDLLTEWKNGGGTRYIDYPHYHQVVHQSIVDKVIETALRLKQNLMIPSSFVDIENPAEENLVRMVTERGLFISQHHVEPMGVSHFAWDNYWKKRGEYIPASYVLQPDKYEEIWKNYAQKWAKYRTVIWQFGLRGRGDRSVWFNDEAVPPTMEARGKLISSAINKQKEIVENVLGNNNFYSSTTLWAEGTMLNNEGHLTFPEDTMIIFADEGYTQMMAEDFHTVKRLETNKYGIYYHIAYWVCGAHLVQGTPLKKIYLNYKEAIDNQDTEYSIINVSNIREFVSGIKAVADITWDISCFDQEVFIKNWCEKQYGCNSVKAVEVYKGLYDVYFAFERKNITKNMVLLDGTVKAVGTTILNIHGFINNNDNLNGILNFSSSKEFVAYYKNATSKSLINMRSLYGKAIDLLEDIPKSRKQFYIANIISQLDILIGLYSWLNYIAFATEISLTGIKDDEYRLYVQKAVFSIEKIISDRVKAEQGKWQNWYRGDNKMNLPRLLDGTKSLLY